MSDTFVAPIPIDIEVAGAISVAAPVTPYRFAIPFNYEVLGVYISVGTAPTTTAIILDVLRVAANGVYGSAVSLWTSNAQRPTIAAAAYDCGAIVAPTVSGPVATYLEGPIDTTANTSYSAGAQGTGTVEGFGALVTPAQGSPWAQPSGQAQTTPTEYLGLAGDVFFFTTIQVGTGTTGSNLTITLWVNKR